ncbi:DivIVA domain-containing protein [Planotetraspora thailandica]|nr:DivIVA domain-containing protein [Planotetraspora thailandica]
MGEGHGHGHSSVDVVESESAARGGADLHGRTGLLSPAAVRNQVFTVVRLREGYDLAEVDRFLGHVETTLSRVLRDNEELRAKQDQIEQNAQRASSLGDSAVRIVEIAQEAADRTMAMAQEEAQAVLARAREEAETVESDALGRAALLQREARDSQREVLERRVEGVHAFVAELAARLRDNLDAEMRTLHALLDELHDPGGAPPPAAQHAAADGVDVDGTAPLAALATAEPAQSGANGRAIG